jgi:hypothetical protein
MPLKPVTIPATQGGDYPDIRIIDLSYRQDVLGGPSTIRIQWGYYSPTLGDAPTAFADGKTTRITTTTALSLAELLAMSGMPEALTAITTAMVAEGIRSGALQVTE